MTGKPTLDLEVGVHRTPLTGANTLEETALVLGKGCDSSLGKASAAPVAFGERKELGTVVHDSRIADIYPHCQRISIRKTESADLRHIIRMEKYETLLTIIAERRSTLGLSERALCIKAGLKPDAVRTIRRGNAPKPETLAALANTLGVLPSVLSDAAVNVNENPSLEKQDDVNLDIQFRDLLSKMTGSEKLKALEILEILIRPDGE